MPIYLSHGYKKSLTGWSEAFYFIYVSHNIQAMKKRTHILFLILTILFSAEVHAQHSAGMTGLFNIPTAENKEAGTVYIGANFLPKEMLPPYFTNSYNSGNYFLTADLFSFLEISYRMTLIRDENKKFNQQDRAFSLRVQALREKKYVPGVAIGFYDPMVDEGVSAYENYYIVTTKGFNLKGNLLSATVGYYIPIHSHRNEALKLNNKGVFAGLSFSPAFYRDMQIGVEYDTKRFNVGATVKVLNCLKAHVFTQEFKNISAGLRYECELWH